MSASQTDRSSTRITIHLFGKPSWEMDLENAEASGEMAATIANLGSELRARLLKASDLLLKLLQDGWSGEGGLYDVTLYKDQSAMETEAELIALGIDPKDLSIEEEVDEEVG